MRSVLVEGVQKGVQKGFAPFSARMSSESRAPCKPHTLKELTRFKNAFFWFYLLVCVASWLIIIATLRSAGFFQVWTLPNTCPSRYKDLKNAYVEGFLFDLFVFLREKNDANLDPQSQPIWTKRNLIYYNEQMFDFSTNVSVSQRLRNNGSLYLHVYLTQSGLPPGPRAYDSLLTLYSIHKSKRVNFFWNDSSLNSVRSYWLPKWSIDLVQLQGDFDISPDSGKEKQLIECEGLTSKYYPILYLNDKFNLARDCIPIDQVDRLPLNISFKQISMTKLRHYLWRSDFDAYFKHPNQTGEEEFVREKLVENDFPIGYIEWIYLSRLRIFGVFFLIIALGIHKLAFLKKENKFWTQLGRPSYLEQKDVLLMIIPGPCFVAFCIYPLWSFYRFFHVKDSDKFLKYAPAHNVRPDHSAIFRTLFLRILLPLLVLCPLFSFFHLAYSPIKENLSIFVLLMIYNCFCYLSWIYWKSGIYHFNLDLCPDLCFYSLFGIQFWVHLHLQLAFLTLIIFRFNFVAMSIPELLIFTIAMLLSDLAIPLYPQQLTHSSKVDSTEFEENDLHYDLQSLPNSSDSGLPEEV